MSNQTKRSAQRIKEISALKQRIRDLEQTETHNRKLFERSSDAIFLVEKGTGRYLDANTAAQRLVGKSLSELKSLTTHNLSPRNAEERLHKVASSDETLDFGEVIYVRPDGTERKTLLHTVSLDEKAIFGIAHDITELKQTEKTLTFLAECGTAPDDDFFQSLARYLAETTQMDLVCIYRLDAERQTAQSMALYTDGKLGDGASYALPNTPCGKVVEKGIYCVPEGVRRMFPRDATLQNIQAEGYAGATLFGHTGLPIGLIALAGRRRLVDPQTIVSLLKLVAMRAASELERTQYEEELRISKAFIETALNSLTDSLYVISTSDFTVLGANKAFVDVIGGDEDRIIGKHCYELTHHRSTPCTHAHHPCPLLETLKTGQPSTMEHIHIDGSGRERFVEVSAFPIRDKQGEIRRIVHIDRDITARRQLEEQLSNHNEILEKLVKERTAELAIRNQSLEEMNIALNVLLKKREEDKRRVEELVVSNIQHLVYPFIEKMQTSAPDALQQRLLGIVQTHLHELLSPLMKNLQQYNLTPKEVQVAAMVKDGKTTKEIAEVLGVETSSIDAHRNRIRKKLGLSRNVNMQSKLQSLV